MTSSAQSCKPDSAPRAATAELESSGQNLESVLKVGGDWSLSGVVPSWTKIRQASPPSKVHVVSNALDCWDTSLVLFLAHCRDWCVEQHAEFNVDGLPEKLRQRLCQTKSDGAASTAGKPAFGFSRKFAAGLFRKWIGQSKEVVSFIGECALGFAGLLKQPKRFRWMDCLVEMQHCWAASLPIVSLVSFLVGVILAFQAAIQLQQFGAAIFVADLVGLAVVREMGPMMAAVIVAGGTGAGFAAQLGNMKVGEEIDALETLGISSVNFLVLPRLVAVVVMMPILALYANVLGVLGGMFVSATMLDIPAAAYWIETQNRIGMSDVASGVIKSLLFGLAVGLSGCLKGIKCDRNASGVGLATSAAVVVGITLIVLADALFAVIFNRLGI